METSLRDVLHSALVHAGAGAVLVIMLGTVWVPAVLVSRAFTRKAKERIRDHMAASPGKCIRCHSEVTAKQCEACGWNHDAAVAQILASAAEKGQSMFYGGIAISILVLAIFAVVYFNVFR